MIALSLKAIIHDDRSLSREVARLRTQIIDEHERAFALACIYGVLRNYFSLKAHLSHVMKKDLRRKDADVEALLLSGMYQLQHMQVAAHATISTNVEAARVMKKNWACGLVNAVLRRTQREGGISNPPDDSVRFEHPTWFIEQVKADWPGEWAAILDANNQHPPMSLRVNRLRTTRAAYLAELLSAGHDARPARHAPDGIVLANAVAVDRLPGFGAGLVSVQDEAAQLAADVLELGSATRVLDACAAPGGKTTHILERLAGNGEVIALDHDPQRVRDIEDNFARLALHCTLRTADAGEPAQWWDGETFDRILVDAPCSATGVIRRHPDIRFHRRATDIATFADQQVSILNRLWPLLAVGGTLVYATCSILPAENDDVIERLLAMNGDIDIDRIDAMWGRSTRYGRQILPGEDDMDGFYYARVKKRSPTP